jgi:hypothetical protein
VGHTLPSGLIAEETSAVPSRAIQNTADVILEQRLHIEELMRTVRENRRLIRELSRDLVEELREAGSFGKMSIIGSGGEVSMDSIIREIETLTPEGVRLIELDRAARRRLFERRTGTKRG